MLSDSDPENPQVADQANNIDFLEFDDLEQSVRDDVKFLKECPLVLKGTKITGWIHYVETSKVRTFPMNAHVILKIGVGCTSSVAVNVAGTYSRIISNDMDCGTIGNTAQLLRPE